MPPWISSTSLKSRQSQQYHLGRLVQPNITHNGEWRFFDWFFWNTHCIMWLFQYKGIITDWAYEQNNIQRSIFPNFYFNYHYADIDLGEFKGIGTYLAWSIVALSVVFWSKKSKKSKEVMFKKSSLFIARNFRASLVLRRRSSGHCTSINMPRGLRGRSPSP